jgi:predicted MFS family arabinose efflux permease
MKKILVTIMLIASTALVFCQKTTVQPFSKAYYLQQSKKQKKTAWILLGCGTAAIIGGAIALDNSNNLFEPTAGDDFAALLVLAGFGVSVGSIPVFINAAKNKGRSEDVSYSADYYNKKNRTQKTIAWILLASGTAMMIASSTISNNNQEYSNGKSNSSTVLAITGFSADIASIVLFTHAAKNKGRAEVAFNTQKSYSLQINSIRVRPVPALTIKFSF